MELEETQLRKAVRRRKKYLISELLKHKYFKTTKGKQLYELTLSELEDLHIKVKCQVGKKISQIQ